jgi:hypothetical protein
MTPFTIKLTLQNNSTHTKSFFVGIPDPQLRRNYLPPHPKTVWTEQGARLLKFIF